MDTTLTIGGCKTASGLYATSKVSATPNKKAEVKRSSNAHLRFCLFIACVVRALAFN
jgi:hypothetical protein